MGNREVEQWDVPPGQGTALVLLCGIFLLGGLLGCLYTGLSGEEAAGELGNYLTDYLLLARRSELPRSLLPLIWEQLRWLAALVLLSLTPWGALGILALFGLRGFLFAFSVACFCRVFGGVGLLPALALFGLPALLWAPALFLAGTQGLAWTRRLWARGGRQSPAPAFWIRTGLCVLLLLLCGGVSCWVVPAILRTTARVIL